ncbi:hypothetical protein [Mesorhizobium sp. ES1-1]|uniref:hypothetical protein n=1 Tax=Mesorhizobium sp. ES1-1 TaxID=2876629 RepID=UPI001CCDD112|nr:hypothetical protein [Mesorhizobium sp. ES1-1]MBZ9676268.1 hypothetical protein [Mesorhizobium sp. ES1-1]
MAAIIAAALGKQQASRIDPKQRSKSRERLNQLSSAMLVRAHRAGGVWYELRHFDGMVMTQPW